MFWGFDLVGKVLIVQRLGPELGSLKPQNYERFFYRMIRIKYLFIPDRKPKADQKSGATKVKLGEPLNLGDEYMLKYV